MSGNEQRDANSDHADQADNIADLQPSKDESADVKGGGLQVGTWHGSGGGAGKGQ
ncbi:hypothetical protein [Mycolicibacterium sp. CBMA 234]|uniref:hypothetical protein n=1 Tax=Mycolicibacterium sp. CBMA 234 TaxID=1918495 RepID=UPI0012DF2F3E|nr:hypothetical protein [Mycolicibacterium sp. CBMA 234]